MDTDTASYWSVLERRSPRLFLVAGLLLVGYATLKGLVAFTDTAYPLGQNIVGPAGFVFGFAGLLGLYPTLADRRPGQARVAAVFASLGAVGFSAVTVSNLGRLAGVVPDGPLPWAPVLLGMVAIGMVVGYASFGVLTLRTGAYPRTLGLLLPVPALVFGVMAVGGATGAATLVGAFLVSSGQAVAHLSIGYTLRRGAVSEERGVLSADVTAG